MAGPPQTPSSSPTIVGPRSALCAPSATAVGPNGELYVLNRAPRDSAAFAESGGDYWVAVYDSAASGDAAPERAFRVAPPALVQVSAAENVTRPSLVVGSFRFASSGTGTFSRGHQIPVVGHVSPRESKRR